MLMMNLESRIVRFEDIGRYEIISWHLYNTQAFIYKNIYSMRMPKMSSTKYVLLWLCFWFQYSVFIEDYVEQYLPLMQKDFYCL